MDCREAVERLSAFVDDELDPVTSGEVTRHVESCASCAAQLEDHRQLGESLRQLDYHRAPDLLRARLLRELGAAERPAARPARRPAPAWRWLSAAAALVAVAGGTWVIAMLPRGGEEVAAREVVSSHIRSLMAEHLADVASTDQHTVKPWFSGKLDFSPPVTDFASADFPLTGGRLDYLQGHPVAALVYMHRKHVINVFVWPQAGARETFLPALTERGYHVIHAEHAGMTYWVASDLNAQELTAFARMLAPPGGKP